MKKKIMYIGILLLMVISLTGCGKNKFKGYWCNYDEKSTIVVLLKPNPSTKVKNAIEKEIETFTNMVKYNFYSKEDYEQTLGEDAEIYDTYVISFDSTDNIGTYIEDLKKIKGVKSAEQSYAKMDLSIYNFQDFGKYTFTDSDEATKNDLETGKYKIKKGVIVIKPDDKKKETRMLYTKDGHLCKDAACNEIFAESNATCTK